MSIWLTTDNNTKAFNQNFIIKVERNDDEIAITTIDKARHTFDCGSIKNAKLVFNQIIGEEEEDEDIANSEELPKPEPAWRALLGE